MKFIVDLDDTLVSSTTLNNDAYNFALEKHGYERIKTDERITRSKLFFVLPSVLPNVIQEKQHYFSLLWLPYRLVLNKTLIKKLITNGAQNNFLWTKADKNRAEQILTTCNLYEYFNQILFDEKESLNKSLSKLKNITHNNEFIIYENNKDFSMIKV
ncbi:MAG: hypothetical protein RR140_00125 [Clostridia bacterium]